MVTYSENYSVCLQICKKSEVVRVCKYLSGLGCCKSKIIKKHYGWQQEELGLHNMRKICNVTRTEYKNTEPIPFLLLVCY